MNLEVKPAYENNEVTAEEGPLNLSGYEDLGVSLLEDNQVAKRSRYLNPNSTIWPMGYGLVTSLYKHKHKKPTILNNYFAGLPEEITLNIFKLLDRRTLTKCTYVCKQWQRIAYDESMWQCLNIPSRRMSNMSLDHLLRRNIKFLSISHSNIYVDTMYKFETPLPKLQYLDMTAVFMPVEILSSLLSQCDNLEKLSLENCHIDHVCCEHIGRNNKLKVLNMSSTTGLDSIGLKHILSLNNLEELNVSWAQMIDNDLHYLMSKMIQNIKRLNISGFLKQLADYDLISLTSRCQQLIELDISDSLSITTDGLESILFNLPNLKVLSMSRCYNVRSTFFQNTPRRRMGNNTLQLEELNIFGLADQQTFNYVSAHFNINKSIFSTIARPKPANNKLTIWEIPISIDC